MKTSFLQRWRAAFAKPRVPYGPPAGEKLVLSGEDLAGACQLYAQLRKKKRLLDSAVLLTYNTDKGFSASMDVVPMKQEDVEAINWVLANLGLKTEDK